MTKNIGEAIMLLGLLLFGYHYGFSWWIVGFMLLPVSTWAYHGFSNEREKLFKLKIKKLELECEKMKKFKRCSAHRTAYCSRKKGHDGNHYNSFDEVSW